MNRFRVELLAADRTECIDDVVGFVGEDASGSFGLMAGHERFMTVLVFGLARLRLADGRRLFVGLPGGLLDFRADGLHISTRRYLLGDDAAGIGRALASELLAEEQALATTLSKLRRLEAEMLQRLAQLEAA